MSTRFAFTVAALTALSGAAPRVDAGRCTIEGEPAVLVMTGVPDQPPTCSPEDPPHNEKGGTGEIWKGPPGSPIASLSKVGTTFHSGRWSIGATADFGGGGQCDIVWVKFDCLTHQKKLTITATSATGQVVVPTDSDPSVPAPWGFTLVGSGHFVCGATCPLPAVLEDDSPVLVWWDPVDRDLHFWRSDGSGGFPDTPQFRSTLPGPPPSWTPIAVADLDGTGSSEIVWRNGTSGSLVYWGIGINGSSGQLEHSTGGFLSPVAPADPGWFIRAAGDIDADGKDDLLFQNECSDSGVVWYMDGPVRTTGWFLQPSVFPPHAALCGVGVHWKIYGPR